MRYFLPFFEESFKTISVNSIPSISFNSLLLLFSFMINFKSSNTNTEVIISDSLLEELLHGTNILVFELLQLIQLLFFHFSCFHECINVIILIIQIILIVLLVFLDVSFFSLIVFNHQLLLEFLEYFIICQFELINVQFIIWKFDFFSYKSQI